MKRSASMRENAGEKSPSNPRIFSPLAILAVAVLAACLVQPAQATASSTTCTTDADCHLTGNGSCTFHALTGESRCVYASCKAGYYGASAVYPDCNECPNGMTSLPGKAFYSTDCFLPCGDARCYKPDDGYAECTFEAASTKHVCSQVCNQQGFVVLNPSKPYATCVKDRSVRPGDNQHVITPKMKRVSRKAQAEAAAMRARQAETEGEVYEEDEEFSAVEVSEEQEQGDEGGDEGEDEEDDEYAAGLSKRNRVVLDLLQAL